MQQPLPETTAVPPPPAAGPAVRLARPRHLQFAAAVAALAWYFCARALAASAAEGIGSRLDLGELRPPLEAVFRVFLVVVGVGLLAGMERRRAPLRLTLGLPRRRSAGREWGEGAALGWALAVASALPMLLGRALSARLWTAPRAWEMAAAGLLTLALWALAQALGVYGYAFHRLIEATGPTRATLILALLAAVYAGSSPAAGGAPGLRVAVAVLGTVLLCLCWTRTHGLWLLWGLQFAWSAVTAVVFGLPLSGSGAFASVVETRASGPEWLTGGEFGPGAALFTAVFLLAAAAVLLRLTSDYAWEYTRAPIIPAGNVVDVPPPSAHTAIEASATAAADKPTPAPPPLVQILPAPARSDAAGPAAK
ncbi:MAG: CPBP family intramembrane metalloprotease [Acidobacteriota bacterium]|nr:CPBP family intramembrane metalloprotease [Acidobacteriota bacterium]